MRTTDKEKLQSLIKEYAELQTILTISEKRQKELRDLIFNFADSKQIFSYFDEDNALKMDIRSVKQNRFNQTLFKEQNENLYNSYKTPLEYRTISVKKI